MRVTEVQILCTPNVLFTLADIIFVADKCRRQKFLSAICQSKHAEQAHARRMGVAHFFVACRLQ